MYICIYIHIFSLFYIYSYNLLVPIVSIRLYLSLYLLYGLIQEKQVKGATEITELLVALRKTPLSAEEQKEFGQLQPLGPDSDGGML